MKSEGKEGFGEGDTAGETYGVKSRVPVQGNKVMG